ncbi:unnamed protein product [Mytilus edulis]|uniref:SWIM-type domain-containing protein n=1 Tax=Mytilus edulis TaxID=6550 RepID=A0A8S3QUE4_MYTED|nr:unnamed protein product [Mytilus edulis]
MADKQDRLQDSCGTHDLTIVPPITFGFVEDVIKGSSQSLGIKEVSKGYKYFSEKYVTNITVHKVDNGCLVKGKCHRSQRKNESPHDIEIILLDGPILQESKCSCAIGKLGTCGHVTGLLYSLAHMKTSNYRSIPTDVLKTSLPQSWHMPRGEKVKGNTADDVIVVGYDTKSPYRQPRGLRSTLYNPIKVPLPPVSDLCSAIADIDNTCLLLSFSSHHNTSTCNMIETRFGKYPKGSPISYQRKLSSHFILNVLDADFPLLPIENLMVNELNPVLDQKKCTSLDSICVTAEESHNIEEMTRLQSVDPKWHAIRKDRLTASVAGDIVKRRADNDPLVARLKTTRKVVTESMRHGLLFEAVAANEYAKLQDDSVNVYPCGIIVSPFSPWLAASPDRKVYNPLMVPPYGLLEIKCPVKQLEECIYLTKSDDNTWTLKRNHNYYHQIMMQLAVTGLKWCHFYVWRSDESHLECVKFDEKVWKDMKSKLDIFYFYHFL